MILNNPRRGASKTSSSDDERKPRVDFDSPASTANITKYSIKTTTDDIGKQVQSVYNDLTTSIFYSMFNPMIPFPKRENNFVINDESNNTNSTNYLINIDAIDPNAPIVPSYDSPVATLKLQEASKKDRPVHNLLLYHTNTKNNDNSTELSNNKEPARPFNFVSVDLALPAAEIAKRELRKMKMQRKNADKKLEEAKEKRINDDKAKKEFLRTQKEEALKEETRLRRGKIAEKEEAMNATDKRKLKKVREELKNSKKLISEYDAQSRAATLQMDDASQNETQGVQDGISTTSHRKMKDFKEVQKKQKEMWKQTKAEKPAANTKEEEIKKILMNKSTDRNSWIKGH